MPDHTPWYGQSTFCFSLHPSVDIGAVPSFWLLCLAYFTWHNVLRLIHVVACASTLYSWIILHCTVDIGAVSTFRLLRMVLLEHCTPLLGLTSRHVSEASW